MYKVGEIYIWQNQVGVFAHINGTETTVIEDRDLYYDAISQRAVAGWLTDTKIINPNTGILQHVAAGDGELRPKFPPSGERLIIDLFKINELEPA